MVDGLVEEKREDKVGRGMGSCGVMKGGIGEEQGVWEEKDGDVNE